MEYRGVEFAVVQIANPTGWTFEIPGHKPRSGTVHDRAGEIANAKRAIDAVLGARPVNPANDDSQLR
jgi:hypothetical protein